MGTEQGEFSDKTPQIGSECLDSEQRVLDDVLTSSVVDEKANQVSANATENSDILLPAPPQNDLERSCQTVEGSCLQQSTCEQVSAHLSNDKPENECQPFSQNVQNEPEKMSDAVTGFAAVDQTQHIPAQGTASSINELLDPPSGDITQVYAHLSNDKPENECQPFSQNVQNEPDEISDAVTGFVAEDQTESIPAQGNASSVNELLDLPSGDVTQVSAHLSNDKPENKCQPFSQNFQNEPEEITDAVTGFVAEDQTESIPPQGIASSINELLDPPSGDIKQVSAHLSNDKLENECQPFSQNVRNEPDEISDAATGFVAEDQRQPIPAQGNTSSINELLDPPSEDKNINSSCSERKSSSLTPLRVKHGAKRNLKKKYILRSLRNSDRALRSRSTEKPKAPEPNYDVVDANNDGVKRKFVKKKKKPRREGVTDQFSKIRANLRYLLSRVGYEQNLIDAYSGEGWKGYSMEKLKPEKELQRAKSEILRRKLKIRDLFRNLDSLCGEGRLPESLFDSEGEIDSEDIFCAKCQSKELGTNNDIILCDGVCDRGFHQLCLDPPLLTEDIPPGDEGWLCPGCDCKDDCIDLVNDHLGANLSLSDTWERIFPEAAGNNMDNNLGLPSDDSDDDDYNPNGPEDVEVEGGESSSDESEYASASENLEGSHREDQYLGLPSEDSEDDDFDPNALDIDSKVAGESSSSDFSSDSEDLAAVIKDNMSPGQDGDLVPTSEDDAKNLKGSSRQKGKVGKKPSITDELSSLLEPDSGQDGFTPVSGKRHVERLDYKKLYDETYQSDTSEDEEWTATLSRNKKPTGKVAPVSPNGDASNSCRHTPVRNSCKNKNENSDTSPTTSLEGCVKSGSRDKKQGSSKYKKLGEAVVQSLHKSFKENQYPDRSTKESLAQELGLTIRQVAKWFDNTRWSFRHSSHMKASPHKDASEQATDSRAKNEGERECGLVSQKVNGEKSKNPSSKKRKRLTEPQASKSQQDVDGSGTMSPASSPRAGNKMKTRKRK